MHQFSSPFLYCLLFSSSQRVCQCSPVRCRVIKNTRIPHVACALLNIWNALARCTGTGRNSERNISLSDARNPPRLGTQMRRADASPDAKPRTARVWRAKDRSDICISARIVRIATGNSSRSRFSPPDRFALSRFANNKSSRRGMCFRARIKRNAGALLGEGFRYIPRAFNRRHVSVARALRRKYELRGAR